MPDSATGYKPLKSVDGKVVGRVCAECGRLDFAPHMETCSLAPGSIVTVDGGEGLDMTAGIVTDGDTYLVVGTELSSGRIRLTAEAIRKLIGALAKLAKPEGE